MYFISMYVCVRVHVYEFMCGVSVCVWCVMCCTCVCIVCIVCVLTCMLSLQLQWTRKLQGCSRLVDQCSVWRRLQGFVACLGERQPEDL